MGGVFGLNCGWEHPLWFAERPGTEETVGFTRQNWWEPVGREARMLRESVGVIDISNFANYVVKGPGAHDWLDRLVANRVPTEVGRSCLTPLISVRGGVAGDFTITKVADDKYMMIGSGMAERYHQRFFNMVELPEGTSFEVATNQIAGFNVAGPKSRDMLQRLTNADLSNEAFRFMRSRVIEVAGVECLALRVSFTGDLGWELHCAEEDQPRLYAALIEAAKEYGGGPVGGRALGSLRIEKGYGSWGREYSQEYYPQEVGLEGLIKLDKDFLHKEAYLKVKDKACREVLSMFEIEVTEDADATGGEPVFLPDGQSVGRVTSGGYSYSTGKSLALGFANPEVAKPGDAVEVYILGKPHKARILQEPVFDPKGERLRG